MKGTAMPKILTLVIIAGMLQVGGCAMTHSPTDRSLALSRGRSGLFGDGGAAEATPLAIADEDTPALSVIEPRKVIYKAEIVVVVGDARQAIAATKEMAEKLGGYMQRMTMEAIVIRIPAGKFAEALAALEAMGPVTKKDVTASDVTEKYVDIEIRLKGARALYEKLLALLEKAKDVKQALAVEKELARVRTQIERLEGQLNRLKHQVAYATISVGFTELEDAPGELRARLPFWWLETLGVEELLALEPGQGHLF